MPFKKGNKLSTGRPPGSQNKITVALKDAILRAAELAGEQLNPELAKQEGGKIAYLKAMAIQEPASFTGLLGKVLPAEMLGDSSGEIKITMKRTLVWPLDHEGRIVKPAWWTDEEKVLITPPGE